MRIREELKKSGNFWLPESPCHTVPGTLTIVDEGRVELGVLRTTSICRVLTPATAIPPTGATAYPPGMLIKIILCAYAEGVVNSRGIERRFRDHVTFIPLSDDNSPHFATLAAFVSGSGDDVARLFAQALYLCDRQGLIGRTMSAIDGVKLPSNAAKAKSGTRADFIRQAEKLEAAGQSKLARPRQNDARPIEPVLAE